MARIRFAQIGVDTPVRKLFDYRLGSEVSGLQPGMRVLIPFGKRRIVGMVVRLMDNSELSPSRLKSVTDTLDHSPLFDSESLALIHWAAHYYQYPLGAALFTALPPTLRKATSSNSKQDYIWVACSDEDLNRAPRQKEILSWLQIQSSGATTASILSHFPGSRAAINALDKRGCIKRQQINDDIRPDSEYQNATQFAAIKLSPEQSEVSQQLLQSLDKFRVILLEGVTGSGKTEVYFSVIEKIITQSQGQVLILVPEIGLTPQLHKRLQDHFRMDIALLHSGITGKQRKDTWLNIRAGKQRIILGTRLAVFAPIPNLQLIVVDEEHDPSFKQQEGFLYHARDVAIYRAKQRNIPIILGSATPSFESLHNVDCNKFEHLQLHKRIHSESMPGIKMADMRALPSDSIISPPLAKAMHTHLQNKHQVILFLNRRGYAPALLCHDCGWVAACDRCDANLTYHHPDRKLHCHHCDRSTPKPSHCPQCQSSNLILIGHGTQRIEEHIRQSFPDYSIIRLDRDMTKRKGSLENTLKAIHENQYQIIIGTQLLSKGHDFPNVSLVGILDIDYGIYSMDFRALERAAQLLIQVAGRSGRRQ
ncbi:MAG: primosomal protein N', partial [Pseudomonadota bacterium]